jgi:hypothetical protein
MKAISFCPPWPQAILDRIKTIEIRPWRPKEDDLPMRVLVHSSQREAEYGCLPESWISKNYPFQGGVILGAVTIVAVREYLELAEFQADQEQHFNLSSWFHPGLFGWELRDPVKFYEPIKCKGKPRFFAVAALGEFGDYFEDRFIWSKQKI